MTYEYELHIFQEKQKNIYAGFGPKAELARAQGLTKAGTVKNRHSLLIGLEHSNEIIDKVSEFTSRLRDEGFMTYEGDSVHTTFFAWGAKDVDPAEQNINCDDVAKVSEALWTASTGFEPVSIQYEPGVIFNQDTVVAKGVGKQDFYALARKVIEACSPVIGQIKDPWGGHITYGRSRFDRKAEELDSFFALLKEAPDLGVIKPSAVKLVHVTVQDEVMNLETLTRVPLR